MGKPLRRRNSRQKQGDYESRLFHSSCAFILGPWRLERMDEKIFHLINEQWTNPSFDLFMPLSSYAEIWTPFFLIVAVALLIFGGFRGPALVFCTALPLGLSNVAVDPLKHAIGRPRPTQGQTVRLIELEKKRPMIPPILKKPHVRVSTAT